MIPIARLAAVAAFCTVVLANLAGCELLKKSEAVQATVNQRVVGMQIGVFLDRFGPPYKRNETEDGSTLYNWISQVGPVAAGQLGQDDRTCTLRLTADPRGKIIVAEVVVDNPGHVSLSRCGEIFRMPP